MYMQAKFLGWLITNLKTNFHNSRNEEDPSKMMDKISKYQRLWTKFGLDEAFWERILQILNQIYENSEIKMMDWKSRMGFCVKKCNLYY